MGKFRASVAFLHRGAALVVFAVSVCGCRADTAAGPPEIRLNPPSSEQPATIDVVNLPETTARRLAATEWTREQWSEILRVAVNEGQPAMLGAYSVDGRTLRFAPMFPLDAGREYTVSFNPTAIPGGSGDESSLLTKVVSIPAIARDPSTTVTQVFPSAEVVPENQLRLYIHFSAPMGLKGGLDYVRLLDDQGREVIDPFLPLEAEFWNDDRTRYTVFFDPGRQKRGILPNQQMGRSLEPGRRYTLVVAREWRDAQGLPLKQEFRREFRVRAADEKPIDPREWRVVPPSGGGRQPLVVTFPEPLDRGLLLRALGVAEGTQGFVAGEVTIDAGETRWSFTPREAWRAGTYQLVAMAMLEDTAGNRIGRAFEVDRFDRTDPHDGPERTHIAFTIRASP